MSGRPRHLPNLETFLANSGIVHLVSYDSSKYKAGDAYISEVMWGTDASQEPVNNSNWIEIRNGTTAAIGIGENIWALWFYEAHETPAAAYPANSAYEGPTGQAGVIIDVIGTKDAKGLTWSIAGKGQSGRSNIDIARAEEHVLTPTTPLDLDVSYDGGRYGNRNSGCDGSRRRSDGKNLGGNANTGCQLRVRT